MADDSTIRWTLASPFGIQVDEEQDAWFSGHVNDILELDTGGLLVATQTGGVWSVDPISSTSPLSDEWVDPDINCLAFGPDDPRHVFAGCDGGAIRETDLREALPLLAWREITNPLPSIAGSVRRIVVVRHLRRIVAACSNGLFWATIPLPSRNRGCLMPFGPKSTPRSPYEWKQANVEGSEKGNSQGFWDVAIGATRNDRSRSQLEDRDVITIVAGGFLSGGLFVGQWNDQGELVMRLASIHNDDNTDATGLFVLMGTCSVASCELFPTVLYAGCSYKTDGRLFRVLRSQDGGRSWGFCGSEVTTAGDDLTSLANDGGLIWNNCISVSPTHPGLVALGWMRLFLTVDSGHTWRWVIEEKHLHHDIHALRFYPETVGSVHNLYVGSDGGVLRINLDELLDPQPGGHAFLSNYNRQLPTLQCTETLALFEEGGMPAGRWHGTGRYYGTLGASRTVPGLIATGAQDNGNLRCLVGVSPTPWLQNSVETGDGGWNAFIADGSYVHTDLGPVFLTRLDNRAGEDGFMKVPVNHPPMSELSKPVGEPVVSRPAFHNLAGEYLNGLAAVGNQVFALYVDETQGVRSHGRYHFDLVGSLPAGEVVAALASFHGGLVFLGTQGGRMYALECKTGRVLELPVVLPKPGPHAAVKGGCINRIALFSESEGYALMNGAIAEFDHNGVTQRVSSYYVLRLDGLNWVVTAGLGLRNERMFGLEAVALPHSEVPHALFVTTDDRVYVSRDEGATWQQASQGLPRCPHCTDLRFADVDGEAHLYLGTYGRSVWVAKLN